MTNHMRLNGSKAPLAAKPQVFVLVGPTGVGKTDLSIHLADVFNGAIVSADSRYLYKGMSIGTAKPTPQQLMQVNHYLIDVAEIDRPWSLAIFQREAKNALDDIIGKKKVPFLVGGTGQYIFCLTEGWKIPPQQPNPHLRRALEDWAGDIGPAVLHQKLHILDAQAADLIDYRNTRRTIRALEVILSTGMRFSSLRQKELLPYRFELIGLTRDRETLYRRIDERVNWMIANGFIEEVKSLLKNGYGLQYPPMSAIGYKEIALYLAGKMDLSASVQLIKKRTRQFVRRQANWFKLDDPRIEWFDLDVTKISEIENYINSELMK